MRIGFIGLGVMGRPMARSLVTAGHDVRVHRVKDASRDLLDAGATAAGTPADAARDAEIVIVIVPDTPDVEQVLFGKDGVATSLAKGALVIDMSSISPVETVQFAERIRSAGAGYLDAPVSGGEAGARDGTLSIMVGGTEEDFARGREVLEVLGKNISHVGGSGAGQIAKVANQIIVGVGIQAVSEALSLARRAGVDPARVRDALMGGFASSRVLEVHGQRIIDGAFDPGFRIVLHRKDLSLAIDSARRLDVPLPATAVTQQQMNAAVAEGYGDFDHSALVRLVDRRGVA